MQPDRSVEDGLLGGWQAPTRLSPDVRKLDRWEKAMFGRPKEAISREEFQAALLSLGLDSRSARILTPVLSDRIRYEQLRARAWSVASDVVAYVSFTSVGIGVFSSWERASSNALAIALLASPFIAMGLSQLLLFLLHDRRQPLGLPVDWLTGALISLDSATEPFDGKCQRALASQYRGAERAIRAAPSAFRTQSAQEWQWAHRWDASNELGHLERSLRSGDRTSEHREVLIRLLARLALDLWPSLEPAADKSLRATATRPAVSAVGRLGVAWSSGVAAVIGLVALAIDALN